MTKVRHAPSPAKKRPVKRRQERPPNAAQRVRAKYHIGEGNWCRCGGCYIGALDPNHCPLCDIPERSQP